MIDAAPLLGRRTAARRLADWTLRAWRRALLAVLCAVVPQGRTAPAEEMQVHAAYVMNFVRYSRWPEPATRPLVIGVIGSPDAAAALRNAAVRAGPVDGRRIAVRLLPLASLPPSASEADRALSAAASGTDVLYVGYAHRAWSRTVATFATGRPILTIGPGAAFLEEGGMIGLYLDRGHVRFDVNAPAVRASPVDVSARLLVLARPVPRS